MCKNSIEFKVWGKYALFTDPVTKIGGEKCSYHVPTYEALKGIVKSIYWKPTIIWIIDKVRIMNVIQTQTKGMKALDYNYSKNPYTLSIYNYLYNVEYHVQAHFEWNLYHPDLETDRNLNKHYSIAMRMLEKGGRQDIFLGTRECQAYIEPCSFDDGSGYYDDIDELSFGMMFHGFDYPDETGKHCLYSRFFYPKMKKGIIEFPNPDECSIKKYIHPMKPKEFGKKNIKSVVEECNELDAEIN